MTTYVALLRGVNLGRSRRLSMSELRTVLERLGYRGVRTHLQSGNALVSAPGRTADGVAAEIEKAIADEFGMAAACVVRTAAELDAVLAHNPLRAVVTDPARYLVAFFPGPVDPAPLAALDPDDLAPEAYAVGEREIYTWHPEGIQRSRLAAVMAGKAFGSGTARNWKTVTRLAELAAG